MGPMVLSLALAAATASPGAVPQSAVDYLTWLQKDTSRGLDRALISLNRHVDDAPGYRTGTTWWCPRAHGVNGPGDVVVAFNQYCRSRGGEPQTVGGSVVCHEPKSGTVLFLALVSSPPKCTNVPTASVVVVEPRSNRADVGYLAALRARGYRSPEDQAVQRANAERAAQAAVELQGRDQERMQTLGTLVCKDVGAIRYTGFVERFARPKMQIRVSRAQYRSAPSVAPGGFTEQIVWDLPENWFVCE